VLLLRRVKVRAQLKARAGDDRPWTAAAGGAIGPIAFTAGITSRGAAWTAHLLGRTVARGTRIPKTRAGSARPGAARTLGLAGAVLRRVRFDRLDAVVHGAAGDPATSAHILGLVTAAAAVVAPRAHVASDVDWLADSPFVDVDCDLEASFVPLMLGWDVARTTLSHMSHRSR
jgi:hypothetical protein